MNLPPPVSPPTPLPTRESRRSLTQRALDAVFGYDFFISYTRKDEGHIYALALARRLEKEGFQVFFDSDDYAMGDDWKTMGKWALHRTSQLVLVASPEALVADAVVHEVKIYSTLRGKRIIPIDFGGTIRNRDKDKPIFKHLEEGILFIEEPIHCLGAAPSDFVIQKLRDGLHLKRQDQKRARFFSIIAAVLVVLSLFATTAAVVAYSKQKEAEQQTSAANTSLAKVNWQLAEQARGVQLGASESPIKATWNYLQAAQASQAAGLSESAAAAAATFAARSSSRVLKASLPHDYSVWGASWSPDGRWIFTWTRNPSLDASNGSARLWRVSDATTVGKPIEQAEEDQITLGAEFTAKGEKLLVWNSKEMHWRSTRDGAPIGDPMPQKDLSWVKLSPDEKFILSGSDEDDEGKPFLQLREALTGRLVVPMIPLLKKDEVKDSRFSSDSRKILLYSRTDKVLRSWHTGDGSLAASLPLKHKSGEGKPLQAAGIHFSPDGTRLLGWDAEGSVQWWDTANGQPLGNRVNLVKDGVIDRADFWHGKARVMTVSRTGVIRNWDSSSGTLLGEPIQVKELSDIDSISPDGRTLLCRTSAVLMLQDVSDGQFSGFPITLGGVPGLASIMTHGLFSPDNASVLTYGWDGSAHLWEARPAAPAPPIFHHAGAEHAQFSTDGRRLFCWSSKDAELWDTEKNKTLVQFARPDSIKGSWYTAFSADAQRILIWTARGDAELFDAETGLSLGELGKADEEGLRDAEFSGDGSRLLTWRYDRQAKLWDATTAAPIGQPVQLDEAEKLKDALLNAPPRNVPRSVIEAAGADLPTLKQWAVSPDGQRILAIADAALHLWTAEGRRVPLVFHPNYAHMNQASFSADSQHLLVWEEKGGGMYLYRAADGRSIGQIMHRVGLNPENIRPQFSPDGRCILSAEGSTVYLSSTTNAALLEIYENTAEVQSVHFDAAGKRGLIFDANGDLRLWDIPSATTPYTIEELMLEFSVRSATRLAQDGSVQLLTESEWQQKRQQWSEVLHRRK